jgi:transcriptional regulator with XRE-family HTH domain
MTTSNQTTGTRSGNEISVLRGRLGLALQRGRLYIGLTQAEVAEHAGLSLKYVGQVERGEANITLDVLERLGAAVGWDPLETIKAVQEPISEGVRLLLLDDVQKMREGLENMTKWLQALDPARQSKVNASARSHMPERRVAGRPTGRRAKREVVISKGGNQRPRARSAAAKS